MSMCLAEMKQNCLAYETALQHIVILNCSFFFSISLFIVYSFALIILFLPYHFYLFDFFPSLSLLDFFCLFFRLFMNTLSLLGINDRYPQPYYVQYATKFVKSLMLRCSTYIKRSFKKNKAENRIVLDRPARNFLWYEGIYFCASSFSFIKYIQIQAMWGCL